MPLQGPLRIKLSDTILFTEASVSRRPELLLIMASCAKSPVGGFESLLALLDLERPFFRPVPTRFSHSPLEELPPVPEPHHQLAETRLMVVSDELISSKNLFDLLEP